MTERCDGSTTRGAREYSSDDASCAPTAEQRATAEVSKTQATEREAEARRNDYFSSNTDEGGRSRSASSDVTVYAGSTKDDPALRLYLHTKAIDPPLKDDPLGNALVAAAAGGALAGARAASVRVGLDAAAWKLLDGAKDAVKEGVVQASVNGVSNDAAPPTAPHTSTASTPTRASDVPVGRSSSRATSEPVRAPIKSEAPRIPEALPREVTVVSVVVRG